MAYSKNTWATGDVITAEKLNSIENAVGNVSSSVDSMAPSVAKIDNIEDSIGDINSEISSMAPTLAKVNPIESAVQSLSSEIASARNYNSAGTANTLGGRIDELVRISNTQPGGNNEIWVNSNSNTIVETQVPTYSEFEALRDSIAQEYSESALYSIGDYVIHEEQLYRCTTAITTAETWTAAHWTQVVFGNEIRDLKDEVDNAVDTEAAAREAADNELKRAYVYSNGGKQVKPENLSFVTFGNNLYDGHALYVGRINGTTGELRPTSTGYATTDFIPLNIMSGTYLLAEKNGALNHNAYGFYDLEQNYISGAEATETNAVEIPSGAEYVRVSYTSGTTPNQIMITRSNNTTAVPYEPFSFEIPTSVINNSFRSSLNKTQLGNELNTYLSNWTAAGGSQWDSTKSQYNIPVGGSISKQFTVEANTAYLIVLTMSADPSPYTPMLTIDSRLVVSLGDASINIFGANDGTFAVRLTPTVGGTVNGVIASAENWTGALTSVSIRKVVEYPAPSLQLNNNGLYLNGYNTGFGTGLRKITNDYNDNGRVFYGTINTSIGYHAQDEIDTGRYNNAYGYGSQRNMTNGSSNNAYGTHTQEDATTAMYNNAFGSSSQRHLTKGCWNVAMGNESQRDITNGCNNVGIGRRAQNDINSGQRNIAIGALAGFICTGRGSVSTINEEDQVLIGCMATQLRRNSNRGIAIGSYSGCGTNGIAIGYGAEADDNDITIGTDANTGTVKIAGKTISFNQDGTVTWS